MPHKDDIYSLINQHNRRLQKLKEQKALLGLSGDPKIDLEIEDIQGELERLQTELETISETLQPVSDPDSSVTNYVRFIVNEFDEARCNDLINIVVRELDIQRQSMQIVSVSDRQVVAKMPAKSAIELTDMSTPKSKQLGGGLMSQFSVESIKMLTGSEQRVYYQQEARKSITERCLIAADVDKTLIDQSGNEDDERKFFQEEIAPGLIKAARMGTHIAAITGNSMHQLSSRFFTWVIDELVTKYGDITPLSKFHLFCNSGGIYINFDPDDEVFKGLVQKVRDKEIDKSGVIKALTAIETDNNKISIHPRFINVSYLQRTKIPEQDAQELARILEDVASEFQKKLIDNAEKYRKDYYINTQSPKGRQEEIKDIGTVYRLFDEQTGEAIRPNIDMRFVRYGKDESVKRASVQVTVFPILSFRQAKNPVDMFGKDFRNKLTVAIQSKLDRSGLSQYMARPGGRTSIDITFEKVDKAYAIEFLIDYLNLQGSPRLGMEFGSNTIYFGDEVIVGDGNDYSVTRIPGLLVFAVNRDRDLVPSLSRVFVPSAISDGPKAVAAELAKFNLEAEKLIAEYCHAKDKGEKPVPKTAVEAIKEKIFVERIKDKIDRWDSSSRNRTPKDLELMHTFVTLMSRDDPIAHQWLSILVDELNAIMTYLEETGKKDVSATIKAIGYSHDR